MAYENVLIIIMLIGLVFFGSKRLPELARAIGRSQVEFEMARSEAIKKVQKEIIPRKTVSAGWEEESNDHALLYRSRLERAALRAGIQGPEHLNNEELVHSVKEYLNG
jgi:sec-independent protein translocase protein TatA